MSAHKSKQRIKAVKAEGYSIVLSGINCFSPYYILPADAKSYAKLAQQVDEAIERGINRWLAGTAGPDGCRQLPHEVLRAIGITNPRATRRTKGTQ